MFLSCFHIALCITIQSNDSDNELFLVSATESPAYGLSSILVGVVFALHNIKFFFSQKSEDAFAHGINIRNNDQLFHLSSTNKCFVRKVGLSHSRSFHFMSDFASFCDLSLDLIRYAIDPIKIISVTGSINV